MAWTDSGNATARAGVPRRAARSDLVAT